MPRKSITRVPQEESVTPHPARRLGFAVDRQASTSLADQVASGLQRAIQSGVFPVGERLPGIRQISDELGVSYVVANRAVRRLADSGLLVARRKTGIRVAATTERVWRAQALWITPSTRSFYFAARQEALLQALTHANIRTSALYIVTETEAEVITELRAALETMSISVVLCSRMLPGLVTECARQRVPLVTCGATPITAAAGCLVTSSRAALQAMVSHCVELGITRPAVLSALPPQAIEAESEFAARGLSAQVVPVTQQWWQHGEGTLEQVEYVGYEATTRLVGSGRLPQLLYVADDYVARGCLTALMQSRVGIPEDMQLIVWGNRQHLPAFHHPFTRIEMDPESAGRQLAEIAVEVLAQDNPAPITREVQARFIPGETTRPMNASMPQAIEKLSAVGRASSPSPKAMKGEHR